MACWPPRPMRGPLHAARQGARLVGGVPADPLDGLTELLRLRRAPSGSRFREQTDGPSSSPRPPSTPDTAPLRLTSERAHHTRIHTTHICRTGARRPQEEHQNRIDRRRKMTTQRAKQLPPIGCRCVPNSVVCTPSPQGPGSRERFERKLCTWRLPSRRRRPVRGRADPLLQDWCVLAHTSGPSKRRRLGADPAFPSS